jgi:hypothetical protein
MKNTLNVQVKPWCLWCYSECKSTPGKLEKYMPGHGAQSNITSIQSIPKGRRFDSHRGQAYIFQACPVWIYTQSDIASIVFTWVHYTNTEKNHNLILILLQVDERKTKQKSKRNCWLSPRCHAMNTRCHAHYFSVSCPCLHPKLVDNAWLHGVRKAICTFEVQNL